ncbi:MAG: ABC transporter substrate-binding protein, partial [Candidatus Rokubacteria bacterium]|nr:ABC transporter substrate-binding protein [Candidatus Rokubacteria bacterium]
RGIGATGGAHLAVHRRTRHPDAAVALARFLSEGPAQRTMAAGVALNPTRMALYDDPDLVRGHPHLPLIRALTVRARPRPVTPYYLMLSSALQPELSAGLAGLKTPRQAMADARHSVEHMLEGLR